MQLWEVVKEIQRGNGKQLKYISGPEWSQNFIDFGYKNQVMFHDAEKLRTSNIHYNLFNLDLDWERVSEETPIKSSFQNAAEHDGRVKLEDKYLEIIYKECHSMLGLGGEEEKEIKFDLEVLDRYLNGECKYDYMHNIISVISPYCNNDDIKEIFTKAIWYLDDGE